MSGCTCDHAPHKTGCPYEHENVTPEPVPAAATGWHLQEHDEWVHRPDDCGDMATCTRVAVLTIDGLEETIAREMASWSDPRVWEHIPPDVQERYLDKGRRLVARALAGDGAR